MIGGISPALATRRWSSTAIWMRWGDCVAASVGRSSFRVGLVFHKQLSPKPGALSYSITTKPHAFFRWIQAWRTAGERRPLPGIQVRGAGSVLVINLAGTDNMTVPEAAFTGQQQAELSWNGNSWQTMT